MAKQKQPSLTANPYPEAELPLPPVSFFFQVTVDGLRGKSRFKEVSGIEVDRDIEEIVEGGNNAYKHRLPGRTKYRNLSLKRGLVNKEDSTDLLEWIEANLLAEANLDGKIEVKNIIVHLLNTKTGEPLMSWSFVNAYPVKWSVSNFNAQENSLVIETLEFAYQKFTIS